MSIISRWLEDPVGYFLSLLPLIPAILPALILHEVAHGYIGMGWAIIPMAALLFDIMTPGGFWLLLAGGISYTVGAVLFAIPKKWLHSVFHVFVVLGSVLQFFAFYFYGI